MVNDKRRLKGMVDELKSCLQEIDIPVRKEIIVKEEPVLLTCLNEGSFCVRIGLICRSEARGIDILMEYSQTFSKSHRTKLQRAINFANWQLMDIGHFVFDPADKRISFLASIDPYGDGSQRKQVIITLTRVIAQGLTFFKELLRMMVSDPVKVVDELAQDAAKQRKSEMPHFH
jgi:hypothetical protein